VTLTDDFGLPWLEIRGDVLGADPRGGFGASAAWLSDWDRDGIDDLAVGEPYRETHGRVWILSGREGAVIGTIDPESDEDGFGWALATTDEGNTLAIGAPLAGSKGAVFLYDTELRRTATFSGETERGWFGASLASDRDSWLIGAPGDPDAGLIGQVAVFSTRGEHVRTLSGTTPGDRFGTAVASSGEEVVSGADGAVWAFAESEPVWIADGERGFGTALGAADGILGDGRPAMWIGAPGDRKGEGRVVLVDERGTEVGEIRGFGGGFGTTLGPVGDPNRDGLPDFAVGSPYERGPDGVGRSRIYTSVPLGDDLRVPGTCAP
jgi:hypothetical protein